jgi:fucose 4-O-acetylase-like acetyltransferase
MSYFPSIYTQSSFWTSSPTYFAIRVGLLMMALSGMYALSLAAHPAQVLEPLGRLGRNSLFVYWIHVELVYGYATWAIRRTLPVWGAAMAFVTFCLLIYGAVAARERVVDAWQARNRGIRKRAWHDRRGSNGRSQTAARFLGQTANLRDEPLS